MFAMSDTKKIGTGLLFLGVLFLFLGVMLFFDRGLLALGNILFLTGFAFLSGPMRTYEFFMRRKMWRGSACFLGGIMLVMLGYVITGMALEVWGFLNLFASFFPIALQFLKQVPFVGSFLALPVVAQVVNFLAGVQAKARPPV